MAVAPELSPKRLDQSIALDIEELLVLVQDVLTERTGLDARIDKNAADKENAEALLAILRVGTSAGGAVPKAIIAVNGDGHVISGQAMGKSTYYPWPV